ncbi:uncharacterized protein [Panulirus ornatus]|uniref:uncharacterized protein n=1 Tax=Panulirus ornatus TaxID=150431 RepID=UPI003A8BE1BD
MDSVKVLRKAVAAAALWMLMSISCHAKLDSSGCPTSFQGVCVCGMGYSRYDRFQTKKFTVNCTNTGFTTADMLKDLPEETEVLIFNGNSVPILPFNILNFSNYDYLDIIDMSNNHIRFIQGRTFHRVSELRLNGFLLIIIVIALGPLSLDLLQLQGCATSRSKQMMDYFGVRGSSVKLYSLSSL